MVMPRLPLPLIVPGEAKLTPMPVGADADNATGELNPLTTVLVTLTALFDEPAAMVTAPGEADSE